MSKYARQIDSTHVEVRQAFEAMGASVADHYAVGNDEPDLLVGAYGIDQQVEVKSALGVLSAGQDDYFETWRGRRPVVARCAADAHAIMCAMARAARGR